jgi:hypothetical protein
MTFFNLSTLSLLLLLGGCGNKSVIKNSIEAQTLGDGKYLPGSIVVPLSEQAIDEFKSPVEEINPLIRGFVKSLMDLGASMGKGKMRLSLTQPLPHISEEITDYIKIKRIFFYIEPGSRQKDFRFLKELGVTLEPYFIHNSNSWMPYFENKNLTKSEKEFMETLFEDNSNSPKNISREGLVLLRYRKDDEAKYLQKKNSVGKILIIRTNRPQETMKYLYDKFDNFFSRIYPSQNSILVELLQDPIVEESFKAVLSADYEKMSALEIEDIEPCSPKFCLDFEIPDTNLYPLMKMGNGLKIDTFMNASGVPKSFQMKGFLEFEVKIKTPI